MKKRFILDLFLGTKRGPVQGSSCLHVLSIFKFSQHEIRVSISLLNLNLSTKFYDYVTPTNELLLLFSDLVLLPPNLGTEICRPVSRR